MDAAHHRLLARFFTDPSIRGVYRVKPCLLRGRSLVYAARAISECSLATRPGNTVDRILGDALKDVTKIDLTVDFFELRCPDQGSFHSASCGSWPIRVRGRANDGLAKSSRATDAS